MLSNKPPAFTLNLFQQIYSSTHRFQSVGGTNARKYQVCIFLLCLLARLDTPADIRILMVINKILREVLGEILASIQVISKKG